jgi:lipopolysaccharide export system protein LptC
MGRADTERAFRIARKHSRRVRILRVALPAVVAIVLLSIFLWSWIRPLRMLAAVAPVNMSDLVVSGSKIKMEEPRLAGFTRDGRPYQLTAKAAEQDLKNPDLVSLRDINAKLEMGDAGHTEITAKDGLYDNKKETLTLGRDIVLTSDSGYKVWLDNAIVDVKTSHVVSDSKVRVRMLQGVLNANRLEVSEAGDLLTFDQGVSMTMNFGDIRPATQPARAPEAAPAPAHKPAPRTNKKRMPAR